MYEFNFGKLILSVLETKIILVVNHVFFAIFLMKHVIELIKFVEYILKLGPIFFKKQSDDLISYK